MNVALFDYGVGNLHSLGKAIERGGGTVRVTRNWDEALSADALVLPGVGAFSAAVAALPDDPAPVRKALEAGLPCLGICLGMQILFEASAEGEGRGIGLFPGRVRRLQANVVPQMGWNDVVPTRSDDPLFEGLPSLTAYYANSFVCEPDDAAAVLALTEYEDDRLVAAVRRGRTWGVQFHPEKSSAPGGRMIANFLRAAAAPNEPEADS
jgi:glutamine amidotransferase